MKKGGMPDRVESQKARLGFVKSIRNRLRKKQIKKNLWLCYARPWAGKQKSDISGSRRCPKSTNSLVKEQLGKLREKEDDEELAAERREYTDLRVMSM